MISKIQQSIAFLVLFALVATSAFGLAPSITTQPAGGTVNLGQTSSLSVTATGTAPLGYQWFKDGVKLSGQTNSTLSVASFQFTDSGSYQVVVANAGGLGISRPALLSTPGATLKGWGDNSSGQLGLGTPASTNMPATVASNVVAAATGQYHSLFVKADGTLWAMGSNGSGQLGNGNTTSTNWPVNVASSVVAAAVGGNHSLYLKNDGTLWAMGLNTYGQLGTGNTNSISQAVSVASSVVAVAASQSCSLFLKADGTLWAMGYNANGQLGKGNTTSTNLPVNVASNVIAVTAGQYHSLFVKSDGTLWGMGGNNFGQLLTNANPSVLPVNLASNVAAIAAGANHSLFMKADRTAWAMGYNSSGQLGNGTTTSTNQPVQMASDAVAVAGGHDHSLFMKNDGTLWAMGLNTAGQLGTGSATSLPMQVPGMRVASLGTMSLSLSSLAVSALEPQTAASLTNQTIIVGQAFTFSVTVTAGEGPFTYQWQLEGANIANATNASYAVASAAAAAAGTYTIIIRGPLVSTSQSAELFIRPNLTTQPTGGTVCIGQATNLSVTATGAAPLRYQWFKNSVKLSGQTNSAINFASFQFADCGSYVVVVTNSAGLVISKPAMLSVPNAPLKAWGANSSSQLGIGTNSDTNRPVSVASNVVAASAGDNHTLFVKADGTLWAMGNNASGQFGIGSTPSTTNRPVAVASNVMAVAAGTSYSLFVKNDGTLWAMGSNGSGQLGNGNTTNTNRPVNVASNVVAAAAGYQHSLFMKADGTLWAMGYNAQGQLGIGSSDVNAHATPLQVDSNVAAVAAGIYQSLFMKADGTLWAMGYNGYGQLGLGSTVDTNRPAYVASSVMAVAAGSGHSLFVKSDGTLWSMGYNVQGQLGIGNTIDTNRPAIVTGVLVGSLGAGSAYNNHSLAVATLAPQVTSLASQTLTVGQPFTFSATLTGGDGPFTYQWQLNGTNIVDATNASYTVASVGLADAGTYRVIVAGYLGSTTQSATLVLRPGLSAQPTGGIVNLGQAAGLSMTATGPGPLAYQWLKDGVKLSGQTNSTINFASFKFADCGSYVAVVTNSAGLSISMPALLSMPNALLKAWGDNGYSGLGIGNSVSTNRPVTVTSNAVAMSAGWTHSLFVKADGTLWGSGYNNSGELGTNGTYSTRPVLLASNAVAVAAGAYHSLFVRDDGTLWAMGKNTNGQLGNGSTVNTNRPVQVSGSVVAVSAGQEHSLFLKNDGTLWAMGYNNVGQLGNGNANNQSLPVAVASNVVSVSAGTEHSLFMKADGTVWAMGGNSYGQLGIGATDANPHATPVQVGSNVVTVSAGGGHSLFVKADGTLWAMGYNGYGALGNGNNTNTNRPISVASNVVAAAACGGHSLFVKTDGSLWAVGYNSSGQLGNGSIANLNLPVQVAGLTAASLGLVPTIGESFAVSALTPQVTSLANQTIIVGQSFMFSVAVTSGDGPFTYQWQLNGTNIVDATNASYTVASAGLADAGTYRVIVSGPLVSSTQSAKLFIRPNITAQPTGGTVCIGQAANLSVTATGAGPLTYQWFKDGVKLSGQTNSTITFASFQFTDSGSYSVVVTGSAGLVISTPTLLSVPNAPLKAWGNNGNSQLGIGTSTSTNRPMTVTGNAVSAEAGTYHSVFVKNDGTVWAMGINNNGQCGFGSSLYSTNQPVLVASNAVAAATGNYHGLIVKKDGTLWGWGNNGAGQLGPNASTTQYLPLSLDSNVVAVAAGDYHTLFVKADGTLWAMGNNGQGQLGNGNTTRQTTAVQISSNVVAVAAGYLDSLFVKADGTLWAMGDNTYGQLGIGSADVNPHATPVQVGSNVVKAAAGIQHALFVKADGTLWAVGNNNNGQLGNGNAINQFAPVSVASNVVKAAAGSGYSLFVKNDGTLWGMGNNGQGQLGLGNTTSSTNRPVQVGGLTVASLGALSQALHSLAVAGMTPQVTSLTNQTLSVGQPFTFSVTVTSGDGPFSYQWRLNGANIANATNASYSVASASMTNAGTYAALVTGAAGLQSQTATLTVNPAPATVLLMNLLQAYDGTAKRAGAVTTPTNLTVNFTYNGSNAAPVKVGSYTVIGTISDVNYYGSATNTLVITKGSAGVTLDDLDQFYSGYARAVTAYTTPAGLGVNLTYNGSGLAPTNVGSYLVIGTIADTSYVGSATNTLVVHAAPAFLSLRNLSQAYNGSARGVTVDSMPAGLPVTVTYNGSATVPVNAGEYAVVASVSNSNYMGMASNTLVVSRASQSINLELGIAHSISLNQFTNPVPVFATASSGLPVTLMLATNSAAVLTETNTLVNIGQFGMIVLIANQPGNANYTAAAEVVVTLDVTKAGQTISFDSLPDLIATNAPVTLTATADSGLAVSFTVESGPATVSNNVLTLTGAGLVTVAADQAGDTNYNAAATVSRSFAVTLATQAITFEAIPEKAYGNSAFTLSATAESGLTVTYASSDSSVATVSGNTVTITGAGTATLTASQAGNAFYDAAANVSQTLTVNPAAAMVALDNLIQSYDGAAKSVTVTTAPTLLAFSVTYDGWAAAPVNVGTYAVIATVTDPNYTGCATNTLVITQPAAIVTLGNLLQVYDGTPKSVSVDTDPTNLAFSVTYNGQADSPTNAGSYAVIATVTDPNYYGLATNMLVISPARATVIVDPVSLSQTYDGAAKAVSVTTDPADLTISVIYNDAAVAPTNAGSYTVVASIIDPNYSGSVTNTLLIGQITPEVTTWPTAGDITYGQTLAAATLSNGVTTVVGSFAFVTPDAVPAVGTQSHGIIFIPDDATNYTSVTGSVNVTVGQATALVTFGNLSQTYDGTAKAVSVTTAPTNLTVTVTYDGNAEAPTNAGSYVVIGLVSEANYAGSATNTLVINKSTPTVTLVVNNSPQTYDGTAKAAVVVITASSVSGTVTGILTGGAASQTNAGTYAVTADFLADDAANYSNLLAQAVGDFVITKAATDVTTWPTASDITYGQTLAASTLSNGSSTPSGTFAFTTPATAPAVGTALQGVTFTPDDVNYASVTGTVNVTVNPALATLEIQSLYGISTPTVGLTANALGSVLTNSMANPESAGGTQYVCTGWSMVGNDPVSGTTNQFVMTVTNNAVLTWIWATNYWLETVCTNGSVNVGNGWQPSGMTTQIVATADQYYLFTNWTGSAESYTSTLDLLLDAPKSLQAHFVATVTTNTSTPLWWLAEHGLTNNFEASSTNDADHDGMPDANEYIAGTDPTNSASLLTITNFAVTQGAEQTIAWPSVAGRVYGLACTTNLSENFILLPDATNLPATPPVNVYTNTSGTVSPQSFYRVRVWLAP